MTSKIGSIAVGHGAAGNILEGGYPLTVMAHRRRTNVDDLVARWPERSYRHRGIK